MLQGVRWRFVLRTLEAAGAVQGVRKLRASGVYIDLHNLLGPRVHNQELTARIFSRSLSEHRVRFGSLADVMNAYAKIDMKVETGNFVVHVEIDVHEHRSYPWKKELQRLLSMYDIHKKNPPIDGIHNPTAIVRFNWSQYNADKKKLRRRRRPDTSRLSST
jgi:hypothetical protein